MSRSPSIHSSPLESEGEASTTAANDDNVNVLFVPAKCGLMRGLGKEWRVIKSSDDGSGGACIFDLFAESEGDYCRHGRACSVILAFYH